MLKITETLRNEFRRYHKAHISIHAAALAYHSVLAIVPVIGLGFWYLTFLGVTLKWKVMVEEFVLNHINISSSDIFLKKFETLTDSVGKKSANLIGLSILLYTAINLIIKFGDGLDEVLDTTHEEPRLSPGFIKLFLKRGFFLMGLPVALALSILISSWLRTDSWLSFFFNLKTVGPLIAIPIPWILNIIVLAIIYHYIPKRHVAWMQCFKAAVVAGPLLEIARLGIALYAKHAFTVQKLYGALAAIPLLLLWLQIGWIIVLSGALLIRVRPPEILPKN